MRLLGPENGFVLFYVTKRIIFFKKMDIFQKKY